MALTKSVSNGQQACARNIVTNIPQVLSNSPSYLKERGLLSISLEVLGEKWPLNLSVGPDWSLYQHIDTSGAYVRVDSLQSAVQVINASLGDSTVSRSHTIIHENELVEFHQFGAQRLEEAKTKFGENFVYYPLVDEKNQEEQKHFKRCKHCFRGLLQEFIIQEMSYWFRCVKEWLVRQTRLNCFIKEDVWVFV
jgi:hypothetical protein